MNDKNLSTSSTPAVEATKTAQISSDFADALCILDRLESLQSFSGSHSEETPESWSEIYKHFQTELGILCHDVQQSFEHLKQVISNIHDERSQWENKNAGLIQQTGEQLYKVTQTTENATQQILDAVEKVIALQSNNSQQVSELLTVMEKDAESISPEILMNTLKQLASELETEQINTFQIMDYLQFQDITAQQIEQAYQLLGEAEKRLIMVALTFKSIDPQDLEESQIVAKMHDPNAEYSPAEEKQKQIDALFEK